MRAILHPLLLAGCAASPAFDMQGAAQQTVHVGGRDYTVWRQDNRFEIVRMGWLSPGEHAATRAAMLAIVAQVTGCSPRDVQGDSGEMRGKLQSCKG